MNKRGKGNVGEEIVCAWLTARGVSILARNYGRRGHGELDIIAKDGETYVFVEVKRRDSLRYGTPAEAVTRVKMRRMAETALLWLGENATQDVPIRFDVAEVYGEDVHMIRDAFDTTDLFEV